ncbi:MAG: amidohydrolase [Anaerolineae bacterium]
MSVRYYRHPKIFTGQDETTFVTAFAVEDGRFTWAGDAAGIPPDAMVENLEGPVVLPGFIDAHTHPTYIAMVMGAVACTVPMVNSIPEMLDALRRHPNYGQGDTDWIQGWGYDESKLEEHRTPTRHDLDQVSVTQPIHVLRSDCHSGLANTRALTLAGITSETPDPPDGDFGRDENGVPNGILREHGANQAVLQAMGPADYQSDVAKLVQTSAHLAAHGIVACTDMFCIPSLYFQLDLYRDAQKHGFVQHARIYYDFDAMHKYPIPPITADDRTGQVAIGGIKLFMDGSMSNRTAWLRDPYPGTTDERGMCTSSPQTMTEALDFARENHVQIAFHAMGDRAIQEIVDFYADEEPWMGDIPSVRIEHASMWTEDIMRRMGNTRMKFGVATNIDFFFCEYDSYFQNLSEEQFARTYPVKDMYGHIEALALSSDSPATTWHDPDNVFLSIQAATTRQAYNGADIVPTQAITVPQAILLYTGRARKLGDMLDIGVIAPGFQASFITLSDDVFAVDPDAIIDVEVTGTWIRGKKAYTRQ